MKPAKKILQSAMRAVLLFTAAAAILLLCGSSADFRGRYMSVIRYERATGQKIEEIYDTWKVTPSSTPIPQRRPPPRRIPPARR